MSRILLWLITALALAWPSLVIAQDHAIHHVPTVPDDLLSRPVTLARGIGPAHDAVSTASADAQAFYDQGLAYLHSYVWIEAARSFNQALRIDGRLAIAHAGLSIAYTELNKPDRAREALRRAEDLAAHANDHDRLHITVRAAQMAAEAAPRDVSRLAAYRAALDAALVKQPRDIELWLLRGIAESPDPADRGQGSVASSIAYYDKALALGGGAAHHFLTHACENTNRLPQAVEHGAAYAKLAPSIPHALHMHGHVLRRTGDINGAVAAFEAANRAELDYLKRENISPDLEWHHEHNLDLLGSSYRYLGQMANAERELKAAFELPSSLGVQLFNKRAWPEFLIARGRFDEALAAANVLIAHPAPFVRAVGHTAAAEAMLGAGRMQAAADHANQALRDTRASPATLDLVAPAFQAAQGQFFLRAGPREKGRAMLRDLIEKIRALPGPDNWVQTLFTLEAIARTARDAGDWEFSAWAAAQMIAHDANYAGSHYARALVAEHDGDRRTAAAEFALAARYWSSADPALPELTRIRDSRGAEPLRNR